MDNAPNVLGAVLLVVAIGWIVWYTRRANWAKEQAEMERVALPSGRAADLPPVLTRTYVGKPNEVEVLRAADADALANSGYCPSSQNYVQGQWGAGAFLLGILCILLFGFGLLILAYLLIVKPKGTLTVTYVRAAPTVAAIPAIPSPPPVIEGPGSNVEARLATLERLRSTGAISTDEYAARRNKILDEI